MEHLEDALQMAEEGWQNALTVSKSLKATIQEQQRLLAGKEQELETFRELQQATSDREVRLKIHIYRHSLERKVQRTGMLGINRVGMGRGLRRLVEGPASADMSTHGMRPCSIRLTPTTPFRRPLLNHVSCMMCRRCCSSG